MSGIFGIFQRDGAPVTPSMIETMQRSMSGWGPDGSGIWQNESVALGQALTFSTAESCFEKLPSGDAEHGNGFTCAGRVDNRIELSKALKITEADLTRLADSDIVRLAYSCWGEKCVDHMYGDWAFAAWHPTERRLFVARDHFGLTALYYYADRKIFAFASSRDALLAIDLAPHALDELYLAQVMTAWQAYHGERTIYSTIRRLPPAHQLNVTSDRLDIHQYWFLEKVPELKLPKREDYVSAFVELFDEAVRARLRTPGRSGQPGSIASTLSGGLDSSAVTATAARFLAAENRQIAAYTSVPLSDTSKYVRERFGDEFPLAESTARFCGNIALHPVAADGITPIQAIRRMLQIHDEPAHAAGNMYWLLDLMRIAREQGSRVLLIGQFGNAGISWTGDIFSQPFHLQLQQAGWKNVLKDQCKSIAPRVMLAAWHRMKMNAVPTHKMSAINPEFARRLNLNGLRLRDPDLHYRRSGREKRLFLQPGRCMVGAMLAEMGAAHGLEIRDPTADARVLAFTFAVPDHIFMDPATGIDRWLVREAMRGRLPDEVRLNRRRGRQAGDLVPRLRACAGEVEDALQQIARGQAVEYVDVTYMRQVWDMVLKNDSPTAFQKAATVLTRGIMTGLFLNGYFLRR